VRLFLIIALLIFSLEAKSLFSNDSQKDSSIYIGHLKDLLLATQKTRGLTNSYLNGNTETLLLIYGTRSDMKRAIGRMESTALAADPVIHGRASDISKILIRLNSKALKMKASTVFDKYTQQIEEILMLAQTVSQRTAKSLNSFAKDSSLVMMESMLPLAEYVGRLRGFGAGIAAKGSVKQNDIEKVYALSAEVKRLNSELNDKIIQLIANHSDTAPASLSGHIEAVNSAVNKFTFLAEKKLLKHPENIDPDEYFEQGTRLIELIVKAYNTLNGAVLKDSEGWL
jgi:hypothetical protein